MKNKLILVLVLAQSIVFFAGCSDSNKIEDNKKPIEQNQSIKSSSSTENTNNSPSKSSKIDKESIKEENTQQVKINSKMQSRKQEFKDKLNNIQQRLDSSKEKKSYDKEGSTYSMLNYYNLSYNEWDKALNEIYNVLKEQLSPEDMKKLQAEENNWIKNKEKKAEADASMYKGGTAEKVAHSASLVESTKKRCYELVENIY